MGKGIIIYQSKYGATRKYAEWLKEATGFDLAETKKADADMLSGCDTVILCGGIYESHFSERIKMLWRERKQQCSVWGHRLMMRRHWRR